MVTITARAEVDLEDEVCNLDNDELLELRQVIDSKLKGKSEASADALLADAYHAYRALQHMRAGEFRDARWELERAFNPPVSPEFRAKHFVKEAA
jgi:hypothetical protein